MVVGGGDSKGRYSFVQRQSLRRQGGDACFRTAASLEIMGDCGAFSYIREAYPPFTPDEIIDFYEHCHFDYGISVDHVVLGFQSSIEDACSPSRNDVPPEWHRRQEITLALADEFA